MDESLSARLRRSARSLGPLDYAATVVLLAVYAIGTSMDEGPDTSMDFYRASATVIPTLLITVAIQGRVFELSRKVTFRLQYRTVLLAVVVFGGEAGALMTIARQKTNWAAHLYVYLAVLALGLATLYLALTGIERIRGGRGDGGGAARGRAR
jgi:peptidoglycan/LPS O-acetylase OafA/YrhL